MYSCQILRLSFYSPILVSSLLPSHHYKVRGAQPSYNLDGAQIEMAPLAAFTPPLGPNAKFCFPQETTLHMKEKAFSLTGDDFIVKTVAGLEVCKCKGKILSISDKKRRFMNIPHRFAWSIVNATQFTIMDS
jgi:hypothetical protein